MLLAYKKKIFCIRYVKLQITVLQNTGILSVITFCLKETVDLLTLERNKSIGRPKKIFAHWAILVSIYMNHLFYINLHKFFGLRTEHIIFSHLFSFPVYFLFGYTSNYTSYLVNNQPKKDRKSVV